MIKDNSFMVRITALVVVFGLTANQFATAQQQILSAAEVSSAVPPSNSVSHMTNRDSTLIWIGTGKGLAKSVDRGGSWVNYRNVSAFANSSIFAIALRGDTVWSSTGFTQDIDDNRAVQTGSGFTFSLDNGMTWTHRGQTLDAPDDSIVNYGINRVTFLPIVVDEQNVTFDIALSSNSVWVAGWSSGIRKSSDLGQTWQRVVLPSDNLNSIAPADTLVSYVVDPRRHNNFLGFAVFVQNDTTIWAGTAGGVNKSTDGGSSWTRFSVSNQASPILANWVIAIAGQQIDTTYRVWITNWVTGISGEQFGISSTDDGGRIWKNHLHGIRAYDFSFKGENVYVATEQGLYRSSDRGLNWISSGTIVDANTGQQITSRAVFSVGVIGDTILCGTGDGIARTIDNASQPFGFRWDVLRSYQPVGSSNTVYAYPNPFSPDDEIVRIHYGTGGIPRNVTIEIFDFGMSRVRTVVKDAPRGGSSEHDEIWDGRDDSRNQVANGVYFYRVTLDSQDPSWGKILVLQ